jgi:hypothetical protein
MTMCHPAHLCAAGRLVAFERSSGYGVDWGRRFVFCDRPSKPPRARHFGSAWHVGRESGSSGLLLWRDRYLPLRQAQSLP